MHGATRLNLVIHDESISARHLQVIFAYSRVSFFQLPASLLPRNASQECSIKLRRIINYFVHDSEEKTDLHEGDFTTYEILENIPPSSLNGLSSRGELVAKSSSIRGIRGVPGPFTSSISFGVLCGRLAHHHRVILESNTCLRSGLHDDLQAR